MITMIRKANAFEILNHWITAASFFILAVTGFGFLFHLEQLNGIFGSFNNMKVVHNWTGVVFTASIFLQFLSILPELLRFDSDDIAWILRGGGYFSKKVAAPPQGKLNAGQKLYALFVIAAGIAMAGSGFVIWLLPGIKKWILLSHLIHNISLDLFMIAVPLHIYMATLANPGTSRVMIFGTVPLQWAKKKHPKWVQRMGY
jgi:formate dehydrogenase subunit gamma